MPGSGMTAAVNVAWNDRSGAPATRVKTPGSPNAERSAPVMAPKSAPPAYSSARVAPASTVAPSGTRANGSLALSTSA